jgi:hypothetical protein
VGFEPTILAFERVKTFHAVDREATVIGSRLYSVGKETYIICDVFYSSKLLRKILNEATNSRLGFLENLRQINVMKPDFSN